MATVLKRWLGDRDTRRSARDLYARIVDHARDPGYYASFGVPDTLDGRFDMLVLHACLVLRRLKTGGGAGETLAQHLFDVLIDDMDRSLREIGVGDLSVGKKVKGMARAFYGRAAAYEAALPAGPAAVAEALRRNVYRGDDGGRADDLADRVLALADAVDAQPMDALLSGRLDLSARPDREPG